MTFIPRGDNTILLVGDSTLLENPTAPSWGNLWITDPPHGYRVDPAGQLSGIAPPVSGDVTAAVNYGGSQARDWYDGDPSAARGCYLLDGNAASLFGCFEIYRPDIVVISMNPNDIFGQYQPVGDGGWAPGFPDNMEATYFDMIDYVLSSGADVIFITVYPLGAGAGAVTDTENTVYRTDGSWPSDWLSSGNENMRVFFNRIRNRYADNGKFTFVDLNADIMADYPIITDWTDVCLPGNLHIECAECQADIWERVKGLISDIPTSPIPATAFMKEFYP
jgi:hypothetical protein